MTTYSTSTGRRTFLRGLVGLPLIGGSLALLGQPTAAAVPTTPELRDRYIAWLANEHAAALYEANSPRRTDPAEAARLASDWRYARVRMPMFHFPDAPDIERITAWSSPSTRAAVILSAAGVPLA